MVRRTSLVALVAAAVVLPAVAPPPAHAWRLVFGDGFNAPRLNTGHWSTYHGPGYLGHGVRRPSQVGVRNGKLVLTAQMRGNVLHAAGMTHRANFRYGRFEARVRVDRDPSGATSGIVMTFPKSGNMQRDGENDIWETGAYRSRSPFFSFIHFPGGQTSRIHHADASQWHTMRMDWWSRGLRIWRDGVLVLDQRDARYIPHNPHHLTLQLDARHPRMAGPVRMEVDWVRIWQ